MAKILIVGAEQSLTCVLDTGLKQEGFEVTVVHNGVDALRTVQREKPDGVVLDPAMAWLGGARVRQTVRQGAAAGEPMVLINLKTNESVRILPVTFKGDCTGSALFDVDELVEGVKALLGHSMCIKPAGVLRAGPIELNPESWTVSVDGETVSLTAIEFGLLRLLLSANGRVLTRDVLREIVWQDRQEHRYDSRAVDVHIGRLRRKLGEAAPCVETVRGVGYRFKVLPGHI